VALAPLALALALEGLHKGLHHVRPGVLGRPLGLRRGAGGVGVGIAGVRGASGRLLLVLLGLRAGALLGPVGALPAEVPVAHPAAHGRVVLGDFVAAHVAPALRERLQRQLVARRTLPGLVRLGAVALEVVVHPVVLAPAAVALDLGRALLLAVAVLPAALPLALALAFERAGLQEPAGLPEPPKGLQDLEQFCRVLLHPVDHLLQLLRVLRQLVDHLEQLIRVQLGRRRRGRGDAGEEPHRAGMGQAVGERLPEQGADVALVVAVLEGQLAVLRQLVAAADLLEDELPLRGIVGSLREGDLEAAHVAAQVDLQDQGHILASSVSVWSLVCVRVLARRDSDPLHK